MADESDLQEIQEMITPLLKRWPLRASHVLEAYSICRPYFLPNSNAKEHLHALRSTEKEYTPDVFLMEIRLILENTQVLGSVGERLKKTFLDLIKPPEC